MAQLKRSATKKRSSVYNLPDHWRSPASGANYPSHWRLRVPSAELDIEATSWLPDQEMRLSFRYWEGAVRLKGSSQGTAVTGDGYVEMTGYSGSIAGLF